MSSKFIAKQQTQQATEEVLEILEMLEKDDGKPFEEKKEEIIKHLNEKLAEYEKEKQGGKKARITKTGRKYNFWSQGDTIYADDRIILRRVRDADREKYIEVQKENSVVPFMFKEETFVNDLWKTHNEPTALICSILDVASGEYIGYCGIKNITADTWEIVIELLKKWHRQGIGYLAMQKLLDGVSGRCGVKQFRVRIDSDNYASQALFEKLGALPNGISEFLIHDKEIIQKCEEDNLEQIDDRLEEVAEKFGVEPRSLLSHVLEYKLEWKEGGVPNG